MTSGEAAAVAKAAAKGKKTTLKFKGMNCESITDSDFKKTFKAAAENLFSGIYVSYDKSGNCIYSMCVYEPKSDAIYRCNIKELELVK